MSALTQFDRDRIDEASAGLGKSAWARGRFDFYIRKGHCYADALRYTLVWCRNMTEQKARRWSHCTGATPDWTPPVFEEVVLDNYTGNVVR